jgi:hypothetical protein
MSTRPGGLGGDADHDVIGKWNHKLISRASMRPAVGSAATMLQPGIAFAVSSARWNACSGCRPTLSGTRSGYAAACSPEKTSHPSESISGAKLRILAARGRRGPRHPESIISTLGPATARGKKRSGGSPAPSFSGATPAAGSLPCRPCSPTQFCGRGSIPAGDGGSRPSARERTWAG